MQYYCILLVVRKTRTTTGYIKTHFSFSDYLSKSVALVCLPSIAATQT